MKRTRREIYAFAHRIGAISHFKRAALEQRALLLTEVDVPNGHQLAQSVALRVEARAMSAIFYRLCAQHVRAEL